MSAFTAALRQERTAMLAWGIGLFLYLVMVGASYAAVKDDPQFDELWEQYPEALREVFGGDRSITSVRGYLDAQVASYLPVLLGIYAVAATTKRLAGAEESGLLDHLLARPVTRAGHLWTVAASIALALAIVLGATVAGAILGFVMSGVTGTDLARVALGLLDVVPLVAFWWGFGLLLGAWSHLRAPALGVGVAGVLGTYALDVVGAVADLRWLTYVTPYGHFGRSDLFHGHPDLLYWTLWPAFARRFDAKDIYG